MKYKEEKMLNLTKTLESNLRDDFSDRSLGKVIAFSISNPETGGGAGTGRKSCCCACCFRIICGNDSNDD